MHQVGVGPRRHSQVLSPQKSLLVSSGIPITTVGCLSISRPTGLQHKRAKGGRQSTLVMLIFVSGGLTSLHLQLLYMENTREPESLRSPRLPDPGHPLFVDHLQMHHAQQA